MTGATVPERIGLILPRTNIVNLREWQAALPDCVVDDMRVTLPAGLGPADDDPVHADELVHALRQLSSSGARAIAYGCTATSMTAPMERVLQFLQRHVDCPVVATAPALVHACRRLGARRIGLGTPYGPRLTAHERIYLETNGMAVDAVHGLGFGEPDPATYLRIQTLQAEDVFALARQVDRPGIDAVLLSCTDLASYEVIDAIEAEIGKPVISSNSATLWALQSRLGRPRSIRGYGRLLCVESWSG
jgi:maleate cis-trans isomerase